MTAEIYKAYLCAMNLQKENEAIRHGAACMRMVVAGGSVALNHLGKTVPGSFKPAEDGWDEALNQALKCSGYKHAGETNDGRLKGTAETLRTRRAFLEK